MIDFVWKNNETRKWRVDDSWSDVMVHSRPRFSNSRPSSLGVADAGTGILEHDFVAKIWRNLNCYLEYSSKHSRNTKTKKKKFWPYRHFKDFWLIDSCQWMARFRICFLNSSESNNLVPRARFSFWSRSLTHVKKDRDLALGTRLSVHLKMANYVKSEWPKRS